MSRNARSNENGKFDETLSNRVNVHGIDDFGEFLSNSSKRNQLGGMDEFSPSWLLQSFLDISQSLFYITNFPEKSMKKKHKPNKKQHTFL